MTLSCYVAELANGGEQISAPLVGPAAQPGRAKKVDASGRTVHLADDLQREEKGSNETS